MEFCQNKLYFTSLRLRSKTKPLLIAKAQGKMSVNNPGAKKKVSDPYINSWIVLVSFTSNTYQVFSLQVDIIENKRTFVQM